MSQNHPQAANTAAPTGEQLERVKELAQSRNRHVFLQSTDQLALAALLASHEARGRVEQALREYAAGLLKALCGYTCDHRRNTQIDRGPEAECECQRCANARAVIDNPPPDALAAVVAALEQTAGDNHHMFREWKATAEACDYWQQQYAALLASHEAQGRVLSRERFRNSELQMLCAMAGEALALTREEGGLPPRLQEIEDQLNRFFAGEPLVRVELVEINDDPPAATTAQAESEVGDA